MFSTLLAAFAGPLAQVFGTLLTALAGWGAVEATKYIRRKTSNEAVAGAMERVTLTAETVVAELSQTMVDDLRAAAKDGKLTKADAAALKELAVQRVRDRLPGDVAKLLGGVAADLTEIVGAKIEQAVANANR